MSLTEQELRRYLTEEAGQAQAPRRNIDYFTGRIRRRRARTMTAAVASLAAIAALAVGIPVGLAGGGTGPATMATPEAQALTSAVIVNGHGPSQRFAVSPGERMTIDVAITVPARGRITGLWFGISTGIYGVGPTGPIDMRPVLMHIQRLLGPGRHAFQFAWTVPADLGDGTILWLAEAYTGVLPAAEPGRAASREPLIDLGTSGSIAKLRVVR